MLRSESAEARLVALLPSQEDPRDGSGFSPSGKIDDSLVLHCKPSSSFIQIFSCTVFLLTGHVF